MSAPKKIIIVRFLLEGQHFLDIGSTEGEAATIVKTWVDRKQPYTLSGYDSNQDRQWAVHSERIQSIFTLQLQQASQPPTTTPTIGLPGNNKSGMWPGL